MGSINTDVIVKRNYHLVVVVGKYQRIKINEINLTNDVPFYS